MEIFCFVKREVIEIGDNIDLEIKSELMKVKYHSEKIWTIENFLTKDECDDLLIFSEQKGYDEAKISLSEKPLKLRRLFMKKLTCF